MLLGNGAEGDIQTKSNASSLLVWQPLMKDVRGAPFWRSRALMAPMGPSTRTELIGPQNPASPINTGLRCFPDSSIPENQFTSH